MKEIIIQDITGYLEMYFDKAVLAAFVFTTVKFVCSLFYMFTHKTNNYVVRWLRILIDLPVDMVAGFYAYMVIAITFFSRIDGSTDIVNLELFSTFVREPWHMRLIIENVIMFIPLGLFLRYYGVKKYWIAIPLFMGFSTIIEIAQYRTQRGNLEIDDVFTNTLGGFLGFTVMKIICGVVFLITWCIRRLQKKQIPNHGGKC